jgi:trehalose transport system substrate-binding protein
MVTLLGLLSLVLTDVVQSAEPIITLTMRLAEAEWQVIREEILPPFKATCGCRVQAIDVPPEALLQRLQAMHRAGRMQIDVFAQDNMRLQELVDAKLVAPLTPDEVQGAHPLIL